MTAEATLKAENEAMSKLKEAWAILEATGESDVGQWLVELIDELED